MTVSLEDLPAFVPDEVCSALERILQGERAGDVESSTLDFKRDPSMGSSDPAKKRAKLIELVLDACVCFANGNSGDAYLVLGVEDKVPGREALTGTTARVDDLQQKVANKTRPSLHVNAWEFTIEDVRLVLIRIPAGTQLYTKHDGAGTFRVNTDCLPLTEHDRHRISRERQIMWHDYTSLPSGKSLDELNQDAIRYAQKLLRDKAELTGDTDRVPPTPREVLNALGLFTDGERISVAAEILFGDPPEHEPILRYFYARDPGSAPSVDESVVEPLVIAHGRAAKLIKDNSIQGGDRVDLATGQEISIPTIPRTTIDEALTNAMLHRDWAAYGPIKVEHDPKSLRITSPGGLVPGVRLDRLLSTPSKPRNPMLMKAMRVLGLAEETSRGFDRIWQSMLSMGRPAPVIEVCDDSFSIRISSRNPDRAFIRALSDLTTRVREELVSSHSTLIVLWHLRDHGSISLDEAVTLLQTDELAAGDILENLEDARLVVKNASAPDRGNTWSLPPEVRRLFEETRATGELRTGIGTPPIANVPEDPSLGSDDADSSSTPSLRTYIENKLRAGQGVLAADIARDRQCERTTVTATLRALRKDGIARVDPDGPQRGPRTRWVLTPEAAL